MPMPSSRREFLCSAAGGISLAWGGLRIEAAPLLGQEDASAPAQESNPFIYGSAFYRPPNPPASQRREMLKTLAQEHQFNIIRIYSSWVYHNPRPDHFDFEELEEVMGYCDEFGIRVLMGVITEDAPYWLEEQHPETRFVDANDQSIRLSGSGNNVSGGWPGLCLDWDPVREAAARFIREMAKVVARHPSMYAYDCWNEPHIEPSWSHRFAPGAEEVLFCYCPRTLAEFRRWLEQRYGSLDALNRTWVRRYPDWNAIDAPRAMGTYLDWIDWRRFIIDRSTNEMRFRTENVRAADPHHVLESHGAHHPPLEPMAVAGTNGWRLAEVVETWGLSLFPRWFDIPPYAGAAKFEITRSNAGGKDFWMTELQGGHGSQGLWRSRKMRPQDIRFWNWLAVAAGAKGIIYWAYHAEATGTEATGFGLVARDGSATERVKEAAANNHLIQAHWGMLKAYRPKPEVAILFDQDNSLLAYAMSGQEDASTESFRGYYKALWNSDLWADFIEPASLGKPDYKVVIAPWHLIGKKETCERLRRFVEGGGTLVLETGFGLFDERAFYNPVVPPHGLKEAFGYREKESYFIHNGAETQPLVMPRDLPTTERIYFEPEIEFSLPVSARIKAHTFLTPIELDGAVEIARCSGFPVGAMKRLGKGQVYYFGTNVGASIAAGSNGGIDLLRALIHAAARPAVTSDRLRPRLIEGGQGSLLAVFNDTSEDQSARIDLPRAYRRATDIHRGVEVSIQNNMVHVTVPFQDAVVLLLE
jgi:beta-galactosidase